jgi:hypothetical protein|tara:strand:- start:1306 stop:1731 length:426 start_codon:yes stop_codon:yes gene_type:complete
MDRHTKQLTGNPLATLIAVAASQGKRVFIIHWRSWPSDSFAAITQNELGKNNIEGRFSKELANTLNAALGNSRPELDVAMRCSLQGWAEDDMPTQSLQQTLRSAAVAIDVLSYITNYEMQQGMFWKASKRALTKLRTTEDT